MQNKRDEGVYSEKGRCFSLGIDELRVKLHDFIHNDKLNVDVSVTHSCENFGSYSTDDSIEPIDNKAESGY